MRSDRDRLLDILEAIERIERHTAGGRTVFEQDELIQTWVVHHLGVIGEACRAVSEELRRQHPEIPWVRLVGMRNILVHHYFGIDTQAVWRAVETGLPDLKKNVSATLTQLPTSGD